MGLRDGLVVAVQARNDRVVLRVLDVRHVQRDSACVKERPQVSVPMVVGMTVLAGRRAAGDAEVVLAPANADGPPLGALLWPNESEYVIASQSPVAGTPVRQYDSVVITYVRTNTEGPGVAGVREPRRPKPAPESLGVARPLDDAERTNPHKAIRNRQGRSAQFSTAAALGRTGLVFTRLRGR